MAQRDFAEMDETPDSIVKTNQDSTVKINQDSNIDRFLIGKIEELVNLVLEKMELNERRKDIIAEIKEEYGKDNISVEAINHIVKNIILEKYNPDKLKAKIDSIVLLHNKLGRPRQLYLDVSL